MHHRLLATAAALSDADLVRQVTRLAGREREAIVELVAHIAELETRKLHLREGYGSLFSYCTGVLRLAEHAAYNRIEAARLSRPFPAILDLLADLKARLGLSCIFISHDLGVVRHISDRVLVMHRGEVVESGPAEAVFHSPSHPYTRALVDAVLPVTRTSREAVHA